MLQTGVIGNTTRQYSAQNYFQHQSKKHNNFPHDLRKSESGDIVEFSSNVPNPYEKKEFQDSSLITKKIIGNESLSRQEIKRMRMDRVYTALVKLKMLKADPGEGKAYWPMGVPMPSDEELEEAYKRLTQNIAVPQEEVTDAANEKIIDPVNQERIDLLDSLRMKILESAQADA